MNEFPDFKAMNSLRERGDYNAFHMGPLVVAEDARIVATERIVWPAVFSGMTIGLVTQFTFNLLGIGLHVAGREYGMTETSTAILSAGEIGWWMTAGIIAFGLGGFAAGRLSGETRRVSRAWHGLTSWGLTTLITALLVMSGAGIVMGGMLNVSGISTTLFMNSAYALGPLSAEGMTLSEAVEATHTLRTAMTEGALIYGATLLLGAFAAVLGSIVGMPKTVVTVRSSAVGRKKLH